MKPDPDFTSKIVIKMESQWAAESSWAVDEDKDTDGQEGKQKAQQHAGSFPLFQKQLPARPPCPVGMQQHSSCFLFFWMAEAETQISELVSTTTALRSNYPFSQHGNNEEARIPSWLTLLLALICILL